MNYFEHIDYDQHERVVFHEDSSTGLRAIIAIHNRALGPAIGGCRMHPYASDQDALTDVLRLSQGMTFKCALARVPFGGGKAVIIGDPSKDKSEALLHKMGWFVNTLGGDYITSFDSGTSLNDIRTIAEKTNFVGGIEPGFGNASESTAYTVFVAISTAIAYRRKSVSLEGVRIAIQGLGNVGFRLAQRLKQAGAIVLGCDVSARACQSASDELGIEIFEPDMFYGLDVDVLCPCAMGAVISESTLPQLRAKVIAGGANNQLLCSEIGQQLRSKNILYVPDYVANSGGIIALHHQMNARNSCANDHGDRNTDLYDHLDSVGDLLTFIFSEADKSGKATNLVANQLAQSRLA